MIDNYGTGWWMIAILGDEYLRYWVVDDCDIWRWIITVLVADIYDIG